MAPAESSLKRKQDEKDEETGPASKETKTTPEDTNWTLDSLPTNAILMILGHLNEEELERERKRSCRVDQIYRDFESSFPAPSDLKGRDRMELKQVCDENGEHHLEVKIVGFSEDADSSPLMARDPTVEWIKRRLTKMQSLTIAPEVDLLSFLRIENLEYTKMRNFLKTKCNIKKATLYCGNWSIENIANLLPIETRLQIFTSFGNWRCQNLDPVMPRVYSLKFLCDLSRTDAERFLQHKQLEQVSLDILEYFPIACYFDEWKQNDREIDYWIITSTEGFDLPIGTINQEKPGKNMTLKVTRKDGKTEVSCFVTPVPIRVPRDIPVPVRRRRRRVRSNSFP